LLERIAQALSAAGGTTERHPLGADAIAIIAEQMKALEDLKGDEWPRPLTSDFDGGFWRSQLGFTTHISTYDAEGNAVGITSSLGETAGLSVGSMGLLLNNFLGEEDVAPSNCMPPIGERLYTMCSPSLLEIEHPGGVQGYILGSGGSSRIRSVIVQGILYLTQGLLGLGGPIDEIVRAPRIHLEDGKLRLETFARPAGTVEQVRAACARAGNELLLFDDLNLFFGGLHMASGGVLGLQGAGDPRRSGSVAMF
jgi:gamma-glutamyltranspeptidase/glutathione hydrolase